MTDLRRAGSDLDGRAPGAGDSVLAVPEGWLVDPLSEAGLHRALAGAGHSWLGVAAERAELPAGSSYRVRAERAALRSPSAAPVAATGRIEGAVLLRAGVPYQVEDDAVFVMDAPLLVDPCAVSFDPWRSSGSPETASPAGRPPFPRRPVALFLGLETDPDVADWARVTVNALVRNDTEGRIAVPRPTGGLHLTRPCLPSAASVAALRPDVIVALDARAGAVAGPWLEDDRGATVVQLTEDTSDQVELVSWRIGNASGRLRARIGQGAAPDALHDLVRRLCAGPQPAPPRDRPPGTTGGLAVRRSRDRRRQRPSMLALVGSTSSAARARFDHLADHTARAGIELAVLPFPDELPTSAFESDVLLLQAASDQASAVRLVRARQAAGKATVIDLVPSNLEIGDDARVLLTPAAEALVGVSGLAIAAGQRACGAARAAGARTLLVPTFLAQDRVAELQRAREDDRAPDGTLRVGWHTSASGSGAGAADRAVAALLGSLLASRPDLLVEVVGDVERVANLVPDHRRVHVAAGPPSTGRLASWVAQVWTAPPLRAEVEGEVWPVVEAHLLGVPTLLEAEHACVADGLVPPALAIGDAGASASWEPLAALLADPALRARRSLQVQHLADGLYGPTAVASFVNRLVGWIGHPRAA